MIESIDARCELQVGEPVDDDSLPGLQDMDDLSSGGDRSDHQPNSLKYYSPCFQIARYKGVIFQPRQILTDFTVGFTRGGVIFQGIRLISVYLELKHWLRIFRISFELFYMFTYIVLAFRSV